MFAAGDVCALKEEKTAERAMAHADLIVEHLKSLAKGSALSKRYKAPSKPPLQVITLSEKRALAIFDGEVREVTGSAATRLQGTISNAILKRIKSSSNLRARRGVPKTSGMSRNSSASGSSSSLNIIKAPFEGKALFMGLDNAVSKTTLRRFAATIEPLQIRVALRQGASNKTTRRLCEGLGVEVVEYNPESPHTLVLAAKGIRVVYVSNPILASFSAELKKLLVALEGNTTVRTIVLSSEGCLHAEEDKSVVAEWMLDCEEMIEKRGLSCVSIRSSLSCSFLAAWQRRSVQMSRALRLPFPEALRISWIHPNDISKVVIKVLMEEDQLNRKSATKRVIELTGPAPISGHEISSALSTALGETVYYINVAEKGEKAFWETEVGLASDSAQAFTTLTSVVRCGSQAITANTFSMILPEEKPQTFDDWLKENVHDFL